MWPLLQGTPLPPLPAEVLWAVLILLVALPVTSIALLLLYAATTRFDVRSVELKDETLLGLAVGAGARLLVGEMRSIYLPLEITMERRGWLPLTVRVRDVELRISIEDRYLSTVTESESFIIPAGADAFIVPVHTQVRLRGRLLDVVAVVGRLLDDGEVKLSVEGHLIVKHWLFTRTVPVNVTRHVPVRRARPVVEEAAWRRVDRRRWRLELTVRNPSRGTRLKGRAEVVVEEDRALGGPVERARHGFDLDLGPGKRRTLTVEAEDPGGRRGLRPVLRFEGRRVWPGPFADKAPTTVDA